MLKTIKTTKQMRLDELIKYVWDNGIRNTTFKSNYSAIVRIDEHGDVRTPYIIHRNDLLTVEIEEPITKITGHGKTVDVQENKTLLKELKTSIDEILNSKREGSASEIYALIDGRLELVWERDGE